MDLTPSYAAIDLGSNSFHMIIAREVNGQVQLVDRHKETVRLRLGLDEQGNLSTDAQERALACLSRFQQRLRGIDTANIRAVGTNTLRLASNAGDFLERAQEALGHHIEIIAGHEEARLIFVGVTHFLPPDDTQRLVIDIGGGSTEFIIGDKNEPKRMISTEMGCVAITQRFNLTDHLSAEAFADAVRYCQLTLRPHVNRLKSLGWDKAIGASGSIKAISEILVGNQWSSDGVTLEGMQKLAHHLIKGGALADIKLAGLSEDRKPVIGGGLAVLMAAFQLLSIDRMSVSQGALREGLILDMLGRANHIQDVRETSIQSLLATSRVDTAQAQRVAMCAESFFNQTCQHWSFDHPNIDAKLLLRWAALTHEVGYFISSRRYRHHTAYILQNADLAGFTQYEQALLAWMGLHHRSKILPIDLEQLNSIDDTLAPIMLHLTVLLRLAVRLHRGRDDTMPEATLKAQGRTITLSFTQDWIDHNPLTKMDLISESKRLEAIGFKLDIN